MSNFAGLLTRESGEKMVVEIDAQNVDFRNCETIKSAIHNIVTNGKSHIILNLGKVGFMDSSGLSVLLYCKRLCEESGGSFVLCGLQSYVNSLVNLTNLNKSIPIYEDENQAISHSS